MKRRLFALLALPALALGFAFASPGADQAQASFPSIHTWCAFVGSKMAEAEYYGNAQGYIYWSGKAEDLGCIPDL